MVPCGPIIWPSQTLGNGVVSKYVVKIEEQQRLKMYLNNPQRAMQNIEISDTEDFFSYLVPRF